MPWLELRFQTDLKHIETASDLLTAAGAQAVSFQDAGDQPLYEPDPEQLPLWEKTTVIALFDTETNIDALVKSIEKILALPLPLTYEVISVADQDWQKIIRDSFHPIAINDRLWICPSWEMISDSQAAIVQLDPGVAFGTGSHATTRLCLEWLTTHNLEQQIVIDYGCGSGILSIAAIKLGAQSVWAIDIDPQALEATRDNAQRNDIITLQLHTVLPTQLPELSADILVANILAQPLLELAPVFARIIKPGGSIVLSGILDHQVDKPRLLDGWACLSGKRLTD
jgi:ribosomal protein L11 methyltransferase